MILLVARRRVIIMITTQVDNDKGLYVLCGHLLGKG